MENECEERVHVFDHPLLQIEEIPEIVARILGDLLLIPRAERAEFSMQHGDLLPSLPFSQGIVLLRFLPCDEDGVQLIEEDPVLRLFRMLKHESDHRPQEMRPALLLSLEILLVGGEEVGDHRSLECPGKNFFDRFLPAALPVEENGVREIGEDPGVQAFLPDLPARLIDVDEVGEREKINDLLQLRF